MKFDQETITRFREIVDATDRCAIVCHMSPDGDALGSSLCLRHLLTAMGKSACVVVPDAFPATLAFLPGTNDVVVASYDYVRAKRVIDHSQAVFCLDFNELQRLDRFAPYVEASDAVKVNIDHHLNPSGFADLTVSCPEKSSTSALLYMLADQAGFGEYITPEAAECCCAGMMTDTGNFSYNSDDPDLYIILADIVRRGVDKDALYKQLFNISTERRIRIMGFCQYKNMFIVPEHRAAIITLSKAETDDLGYRKGDTEALVNIPLSIPETVWSVYLREMEPGFVKVSMRSKGEFSVRDICADNFGGGGHCNAAGGEFRGTIDDTIARLLEIMPKYDKFLPSN